MFKKSSLKTYSLKFLNWSFIFQFQKLKILNLEIELLLVLNKIEVWISFCILYFSKFRVWGLNFFDLLTSSVIGSQGFSLFEKYIRRPKSSNLILNFKISQLFQTSNFKETAMSQSNISTSTIPQLEEPQVLKTKITALVGVLGAPRKAQTVKLQLKPGDDRLYGAIEFEVTPTSTPNCTCPCAPKAVRWKMAVYMRNNRRLRFEDDE